MKALLDKLFTYHTFSKQEAKQALEKIAKGDATAAQMAAFMTVFLMRPITVEELSGFREAMLEMCLPVNLDGMPSIDVCGTGGDGKNTFNISTTTAFILAACGVKVSKHGNYGVSSKCGSSTLLEALGYNFSNKQDELKRQLERYNICFLHAPLFHPAMKNVAPVRRELGVKTFFNMLGPLVNPARPTHQMVGVFSLELGRLYNYLLQEQPLRYSILHGLEGYDEITLTGLCKLWQNEGERIIHADDFGLKSVSAEGIKGQEDALAAAEELPNLLKGIGSFEKTEVLLANSAMALTTTGFSKTFEEGVAMANEALKSGAVYNNFKKFINND